MFCTGCSGLTSSSIHFGGKSIADSLLSYSASYKLKPDFIYRNRPINCYYGVSGPNGNCPVFTDCSFCANTNYHNCHDIINVDTRIDSLSRFLFNNISTCSNNFVGIKAISLDKKITCFPNPTSGKLTIEVNDYELTISQIELISYTGSLLSIHKITDNTTQLSLDLNSLKHGIYFMKIYTQKGFVTKKIVKN